ncbi:unnamed protein product [Pleuronectes platessa]|uniref:Uncharacterized protein n=1 Tax=Pleuronectes platessa TaxID=8262 RepID=A0A9N7UUP4_PLEPL|nr:unnamed protein product [Pleuronectes platessa]
MQRQCWFTRPPLHRSSSSSSSSWVREHPGGACAGPLPLRRDSESSDQNSLLSVTSADDFSDDIPLLKEA